MRLTPEGEALAQLIRKADHDYQRAIANTATTQALLYEKVQRARDHGMTWAAIAKIFGTTTQAVQQRFSKAPPGRLGLVYKGPEPLT